MGLFETPDQLKEPLPKEESIKKPTPPSIIPVVIVSASIIVIFLFLLWYSKTGVDDIKTVCFGTKCIQGEIQDEYTFNGFPFYQIHEFWFTQIERKGVQVNTQFRYGPREVKKIPVSGRLNNTFWNSSVMYVTFDPLAENLSMVALASGELQFNLAQAFSIELIAGCMNQGSPVCETVPEVTCQNTNNATVIELNANSPAGIKFDGHCITLSGKNEELIQAVDLLLLAMYGIIDVPR